MNILHIQQYFIGSKLASTRGAPRNLFLMPTTTLRVTLYESTNPPIGYANTHLTYFRERERATSRRCTTLHKISRLPGSWRRGVLLSVLHHSVGETVQELQKIERDLSERVDCLLSASVRPLLSCHHHLSTESIE